MAQRPRRRRTTAAAEVAVYENSPISWGVHIDRFGKVEGAEIRTAALTMLLGKNNTGKSYVATLLWALQRPMALLNRTYGKENRPAWFKNAINRAIQDGGTVELQLTAQRVEEVVANFNEALREDGPAYFASVFAFDGFRESSVSLSIETEKRPLTLRIIRGNVTSSRKGQTSTDVDTQISVVVDETDVVTASFRLPNGLPEIGRYIDEFAYNCVVESVFRSSGFPERSPAYLPAARTGLMLAFRPLISQLINRINPEQADAAPLSLPLPVTTFLQMINWGRRDGIKSSQSAIADWVEKTLLDGHVIADDAGGITRFSYRPTGSKTDFPLHATSSMISELAPFLVMMRSIYQPTSLVFEEPEAHLHLAAQRVIARAIARLVNSGVSIILTTHSDTFVQQINNLLQVSESSDRDRLMAEYGYEEQDLLSGDKIVGYEFFSKGSMTNVRKLERSADGLIVPSLNDTLISLATETIELNGLNHAETD